MPKADTSVKWFHSGMPGAPVLRGEPGALIEVLDACLINGFDSRAVDSIVVAGGVATVSLSAGNPFEQNVVVQLAGATPADLNAEWRIATRGASSFTFLCPGIADGAATGTITCKRAAAGWVKPFSATGKAVYQSQANGSTQFYLRLDDADARYTRVRGYEQMTDVDTGTELFPTLTQLAATSYTWPKSDTGSSASRQWALISDGRMMHFLPAWYAPVAATKAIHEYLRFGDFQSFTVNDPFACCIAAAPSASPSFVGSAAVNSQTAVNTPSGCYLARGRTAAIGAVRHVHACAVSEAGLGAAVAEADRLVPLYLLNEESLAASTLRGVVPGAYLVYGKKETDVGYLHDVTATSDFLYVRTGRGDQTANFAFMCFDVLGPWQ